MTLAIDAEDVTGLLLRGHAQWFDVSSHEDGRSTFGWDTYEVRLTLAGRKALADEPVLVLGEDAGSTPTAIAWRGPDGNRYAAPATDLIALRYKSK